MAKELAIGTCDRNDQATRLSVTQWIGDDGDLVTGLETPRLPTFAHQLHRRAHLDSPLDGRGFRVVGIGNEDLNPAVWVGPLKLLHRTDERNLLCLIEHCPGMMGKGVAGGENRGD